MYVWLRLSLPEVVQEDRHHDTRKAMESRYIYIQRDARHCTCSPNACARDKECPCYLVIIASWKLLRQPS
jgi:hypothetical protein